jgi:phosphoribosylamine--glycine ligase
MRILVIGSGGREHAIAWKLKQSPKVSKVFVAPGNAGTGTDDGLDNVNITDTKELIEFAKTSDIALTVVGPEAPLSEGIVDSFEAAGLKIFGPRRAPAQLESSKEFAKNFMDQYGIPTAAYKTFTDATAAHTYIDQRGVPIVVKADGLAAGKGVVVAMTLEEAHNAVDMMLVENGMGLAGAKVVIEDFLSGEEASFIVMIDGRNILPLATSQDHKRLLENDEGPNTGGMGAYSPAPVVTPEIHAKAIKQVIQPVVDGMNDLGTPFTGFLYAGLMIPPDGSLKVLEFNCRLGDPETQPIMMRLKTDLVTLIQSAINGTLDTAESEWDRRPALGIVLAAHGYPQSPRKGDVVSQIPEETPEVKVFHAGTSLENQNTVVSGGRVLCVTALGENIQAAQKSALEIAEKIKFDGKQFRKDIGYRAIKRA